MQGAYGCVPLADLGCVHAGPGTEDVSPVRKYDVLQRAGP